MERTLSEILLRALIDGGVEKIMQAVSEYLKYPIMLVDVGYNLISHYPDEKINDPLWDAIHEFGTTPPYFINKLHIENMMILGVNETEPYYIDWGFLKDYPRILVNIFSNNKYYGYFTVLCDKNTLEMLEDVKLIGSVLAIALQKQNADIPASQDYQTMFLKYLFDEKIVTKEQLKNWEQYLSIPIKEPFYVGCSSYDIKKDSTFTLNFIRAFITKIYPGTLFITKNKYLIFLFTNMKSEEHAFSFIEILQKAFADYKLRFGISNQFFELEKAFIYLNQANYALSIAREKKQSCIRYRDCILNQVTSVIYAALPRESYIHEAIDRIAKYDIENNTKYYKTLKVYVESLFNAKNTVEILHIHRNTLPHRLEMIEKIGGISLKDTNTCTALLLDFFMEADFNW